MGPAIQREIKTGIETKTRIEPETQIEIDRVRGGDKTQRARERQRNE